MSNTAQALAEAAERRETRERTEHTSEGDVRVELALVGFTRDANTDALLVARCKGSALMEGEGVNAVIWYDYDSFTYNVVVYHGTQEG